MSGLYGDNSGPIGQLLSQQGIDSMPVESLSSIQSAKCEYVIVNREDPIRTTTAKSEIIKNLGIGDINSIYVTTAIETVRTEHSGLGILWLGPIKPLMRGVQDVPTAGDDVAIVWVEDEPYWLCILNSKNSVQCNWNAYVQAKNVMKAQATRTTGGTYDGKKLKGVPDNVMYTGLGRLEKPFSQILDDPDGAYETDNMSSEEYLRSLGAVGDLYIEGKFGNSIRLGSRNNHPNLTISNLRQKEGAVNDNSNDVLETPQDGGLITMLSNNTIQDNFLYTKPWLPSSNVDNNKQQPIVFDSTYVGNQMLLTSDRLIIDSRKDTLCLTSFDDIEMGSAANVNIRAAKSAVIDSTKVYIGKGADKETEPMVLGTQLKELLEKLIDGIGQLNVSGTIAGFSGPISTSPAYNATVKPLLNELKDILSDKHFIEPK